MLGLVDLMLDCWLEVSLHPEGPATGQLKVFRGFPWSQRKCLSWYLNSTLHCMLPMQPLPMVTLKISPYTNATLTFDFGLDHLVHGGYG
jgi:hypothetical protein